MVDKLDIYVWAIFVGLAFIGYLAYYVISPTIEIALDTNAIVNKTSALANDTNRLAENTNTLANTTNQTLAKVDQVLAQGIKQNDLTIRQNKEIIDNQNNNTKAIAELVQENRKNQDEAIYYLVSILNQSNIIGNQTADDIRENINVVKELEKNQTEERRIQTAGIIKGFSYLLEDLDEESDKTKQILLNLAEQRNVTLPNKTKIDEFRLDPERNQFTFPNGTTISLRELFKPAVLLTIEGRSYNDTEGRISGFLGGPMLTNETIPLEFRSLLNRSNTTGNNTD